MNYPIPDASMARIQQAYASFEQITAIIAEALGVDVKKTHYRLDMAGRQFVVADSEHAVSPNGLAPDERVVV